MSDPEYVRVLYSDYGNMHFLINRDQCPASVYAEKPIEWDSGYRYYRHRIHLENDTVPLFNLHHYLMELFHFRLELQAYLVILLPLDRLEKGVKTALQKGPLASAEEQPSRIGVQISSETVIQQLPLREFQPHPTRLRTRLHEAGFPATHPGEESFGFLIDLYRTVSRTAGIADEVQR